MKKIVRFHTADVITASGTRFPLVYMIARKHASAVRIPDVYSLEYDRNPVGGLPTEGLVRFETETSIYVRVFE